MCRKLSSHVRPRLSELGTDLLHLTWRQRSLTIALPFVAFTAYWIFATSGLWILAILSLMVLSFASYGSTSHDLVHSSLDLQPKTNDMLLSVIEVLALRSGHAYQAAHLHHHSRFPHEDDIEADASRMSLIRTLFEGVIFQFRIYTWALKHPGNRLAWIVVEGVAVCLIVIMAIATKPVSIIPAAYVALMIAGSWIIPLITSYLPHDPNGRDELHQTRLFRGRIVQLLAFEHLYHLEHHLYPKVPHQKWPLLAKRLDPWFDKVGIKAIRLWF